MVCFRLESILNQHRVEVLACALLFFSQISPILVYCGAECDWMSTFNTFFCAPQNWLAEFPMTYGSIVSFLKRFVPVVNLCQLTVIDCYLWQMHILCALIASLSLQIRGRPVVGLAQTCQWVQDRGLLSTLDVFSWDSWWPYLVTCCVVLSGPLL